MKSHPSWLLRCLCLSVSLFIIVLPFHQKYSIVETRSLLHCALSLIISVWKKYVYESRKEVFQKSSFQNNKKVLFKRKSSTGKRS